MEKLLPCFDRETNRILDKTLPIAPRYNCIFSIMFGLMFNVGSIVLKCLQTLIAISQVTNRAFHEDPAFFPIKPLDYGRLLVISIGTGSPKQEKKYDAKLASSWGVLGWLVHGGSSPILDVYSQASTDLVDFHICVVFQALHSEDNYLRIQDDTLLGTVSSVDIATKENLDELSKAGEELLKKPVSRVNLETGISQPIKNGGSNEDALKRFAKRLSDERKLRESTMAAIMKKI